MTDYARLLRVLAESGTKCVLVGGIAALAHGAARATYDVDVVYSRTPENIARLVSALAPLEPHLRGAPRGLPFTWAAATVSRGLNFTLTTTAGDIDVLGRSRWAARTTRCCPTRPSCRSLGSSAAACRWSD